MYKYGMKLRGYSIGCQPAGVKKHEEADKTTTGYWDIIYYEEKLSQEEEKKYDLEFIGEEE